MIAPPRTPAQRTSALAALREKKLRDSVHAFVRASAPLFYRTLATLKIPRGPAIWICGDCHAENVGAVPDAKGNVVFGMNDFDETVVGDAAFDVVRMALSLVVALRGAGHAGAARLATIDALLEGYAGSLGVGRAPPLAERFARMLSAARATTRRDLLEHLCGAARPHRFPTGEKFWPASTSLRRELGGLLALDEVRRVAGGEVRLVDVAHRIAGTASLGTLRAAMLVEITDKTCAKRDRVRILDVKAVQRACVPRDARRTPKDDATRIVAGTTALAPAYAARRCVVRVGGVEALLRELMPQERKASLDTLHADELPAVARSLGAVIARAHGRQLDARGAKSWRAALMRHRSDVHRAVAALVGVHEEAYLRACAEAAS